MSEQQDPEALFAQTLRRFQAQNDGVAGMEFTGEVVAVSPQGRSESLYTTLVITEGPATGNEIQACLPYRLRRFAKAPSQSGAGRVEVGQVLKLKGRLTQRDGQPFFSADFLTWVAESGPHQRDRRRDVELLTGDPDYEKNSFKYADKWKIANHPGSLNSIVLITSRGMKGQQDFTGQINHGRSGEQRIDVRYRDVPVQGRRMVDEICQVLYGLTPDQGDMAVIVRGGGGWSDLRGFDDLRLAEAIRDCSIPVVTAIGHRSDQHLADFAANFAFDVPGEAAIALREGKAIAATRERKRRQEEQHQRAARQFTREAAAQRDDPFVTNTGGRSTPPAPPPPPVAAPRPVAPLVPPRSPRRWPPPFDKVSLLALITSLTCIGPVALVLGLVGCYRTRGYRRRGRWAAVTATILGPIMTIPMLLAGLAFVDDARPQPGKCVGKVGPWEQIVESTIDCDKRHLGEVVYRGNVDAATLRSIRRGRQANRCLQEVSQSTRQAIKRRKYTLRIVVDGKHPRVGRDFVCIATSRRPARGSLLD